MTTTANGKGTRRIQVQSPAPSERRSLPAAASAGVQRNTYVVGIVAVLVWGVVLALEGFLPVSELPNVFRYLGIASVAAYGFYQGLHLYLWRRPPFRWILRIPDFGGRWEGWYWNTLGREWLPTAYEVRQRSLSLAINAWGRPNWSRSVCASILTDPHGEAPELVWTYKSEPTAGPAAAHTGTHLLRLVRPNGAKRLEGKYFTDRPRKEDNTIGQGGFIRLIRVGANLRNGLDYNENWGMPKPTDVLGSSQSVPRAA